MNQVIKNNGSRVEFNLNKIKNAIEKANITINSPLVEEDINYIVNKALAKLQKINRDVNTDEISDIVEEAIGKVNFSVAREYIESRYRKRESREKSTIDAKIQEVLNNNNEEVKQENSNKNPIILSVQRDYIAGEYSRYFANKYIIPKDLAKAHEDGLIHIHDEDYMIQKLYNCCLVNLEDMLQNGTSISGVMIEKPKSFRNACNIASQISAVVASNQYGGQSISLAHLAPFVDVSRQKIKNKLDKIKMSDSSKEELLKIELEEEVKQGLQTLQYQYTTLQTTNGQAPFITIFMYIDEVPKGQTRDDLVWLIKELLNQRYNGIKDCYGTIINPTFPKLIYVLDKDNINENSEYYWLTQLAAKCTSRRMVPDYISAKIMKELKGDVYTCMGCVDGKSVIDYKIDNVRYVESFERAWNRLSENNEVKLQPNGEDLYIDTNNVEIYDCKEKKYVKQYRIIRNTQENWCKVKLSGGRKVDVTNDHPFEVENKGIVLAKDLCVGDKIIRDIVEKEQKPQGKFDLKYWLYGVMVCDSGYCSQVNISLGLDEKDILDKCVEALKEEGQETFVKEWHRGKKGNYYELKVKNYSEFRHKLIDYFGGIRKIERHIPQEIFNSDIDKKCSFMAGLIDADGYINNKGNSVRVQIGSTNKELALQELLLAKEIGLNACLYENHYKGSKYNSIRYLIEFNAIKELKEYIISSKKKEKFIDKHKFSKSVLKESNICEVQSVEEYVEEKYSYDVTTESEHFMFDGIYSHNCRSFLTPDRFSETIGDPSGALTKKKHKYAGRFNQGVVTVSLADAGLSAKGDINKFWEILDERCELCHRVLRIRHERIKGTLSNVSPLLFQYGAIARLKPGETIDKLLFDGYSTISLGYMGLYECVMALIGESHTTTKGKKLGLKIMQFLNDKCAKWKKEENIDYSVYGTPAESLTYKFAKCLQKRFGIIKGITDHNYITNSYHINVRENISAFDKLSIEAEFQALSPGGAISYVELPDMQHNLDGIMQILKHIYNTIMYAEINLKLDSCQCGFEGKIPLVKDETGKLVFECPKCHNRDNEKMYVTRRTCGYLGSARAGWNQGRLQEIDERVEHVSLKEMEVEENK